MTEVKPLSDVDVDGTQHRLNVVADVLRENGFMVAVSFIEDASATIATLKSENADLKEAKNTAREIVARWMIDNSFATGHGDSIYDLLQSLESQVREIRSENEKLTSALRLAEEAMTDFLENPLYQVGVGGNPNRVERMINNARAALSSARAALAKETK